jgi:hypothetical protein
MKLWGSTELSTYEETDFSPGAGNRYSNQRRGDYRPIREEAEGARATTLKVGAAGPPEELSLRYLGLL